VQGTTGGVAFRNLTLWATAGMGVYTDSVAGGVTLAGVRVQRAAGRPMSITADGTHFSNTRGGGVVVEDCVFDGQGDDGMNIPTIFQAIVWAAPDGSAIRVEGRPGSGPTAPVVRPGDTANFFNRSTMALLGTAAVTAVAADFTISLAPPGLPPGAGVYGLINCAEAYAGWVTLRRNVFSGNRARGALLKSSNVHAEDNTFVNCSGPAVKTECDGCYWFEGHPVSNWTFVSNTVTGVNFGTAQTVGDVAIDNSVPVFNGSIPTTQCTPYIGASPPLQHGLNISGNTFTSSSGLPAVFAYSVGGLTLAGNSLVLAPGARPPSVDFAGEGVTDAAVSGNVCFGGACTTSGL
jgi:hypothetical protein